MNLSDNLAPSADRGSAPCVLQAAAAADEVVPVVSPADPPKRAHLPALQGQEPQPQPQETKEEVVAHRQPANRYTIKSHPILVVTRH